MKEQLTVVKLGGNCMDDETIMQNFLQHFSRLPGLKVLVHGGGKMATTIGEKLNVPKQMIEGRRVTSADTLDVVTMVYTGLINKKIVAQLQGMHCNAIGLSGADGNLIMSEKRSIVPVDFGFVGDPVAVNFHLLQVLLQANFVPIIAPVTHDSRGQLLNTNADTIASVIAAAMITQYDVHLLYAFDKTGVLRDPNDDSSVIAHLSQAGYERLRTAGTIHSGMLPKLNAGFTALNKRVNLVTIQHVSSIGVSSSHTQLVL